MQARRHFTVRRIDAEVDGDRRDALVGAREPVGLRFNLQTDLVKVHKLAALTVQELCIFYRETGDESIRACGRTGRERF